MAKEGAKSIDVQKSLKGVDYPASKQELVDHASGNGSNKQAIDLLKQIPDKKYNSPVDVSKAIGGLD